MSKLLQKRTFLGRSNINLIECEVACAFDLQYLFILFNDHFNLIFCKCWVLFLDRVGVV